MLGLGSSKELLTLTDALTEGRHFKFLEVEAYASGGDKDAQLVDQYYFETVFVSSLNGAGANDNLLGVEFGKFAHGHIEQTDEGALGQLTEVGWDLIENRAFTSPTHAVGDLDKDLPLESVGPQAQLEYYIRFEDDSPEWMRLESFNWGVSSPVDLGSATGGAGAGKAIAQPVSLVLGSSQTATQLAQYLAAGKHLESVEIEAYAPGGDKGAQLVDQYYFETVFLSKLETSAASGSAPQESVSFAYAKFDHGHVTQDEKGALSSTQDGWDFVKNLDDNGFGPAVTGDAIKSKLDETVGGALKYYVTFDGAPGWLELSSFSTGLTNPVSIGSATGGAGAGKVSASPAMLGLGSSKELLTLTDALTEGRHFKFLEVEAYASGGDKGAQLVDQYYFETVFVSSLNGAGANSNLLGVEFGKFAHGHIEQTDEGALGQLTEVGWDFLENRLFTAPTDSDLF
jgi:type VI secretion system secreted protein Hcp